MVFFSLSLSSTCYLLARNSIMCLAMGFCHRFCHIFCCWTFIRIIFGKKRNSCGSSLTLEIPQFETLPSIEVRERLHGPQDANCVYLPCDLQFQLQNSFSSIIPPTRAHAYCLITLHIAMEMHAASCVRCVVRAVGSSQFRRGDKSIKKSKVSP